MHTEEPDNDYMAYGGGVAYGLGGRRWWLNRDAVRVVCVCRCCYVVCLYAGQAPPDGARTLWRCVCVQWVGSSRRDVHYCLCPPVCAGTQDEGPALRFKAREDEGPALCLLRHARTKDLPCLSC